MRSTTSICQEKQAALAALTSLERMQWFWRNQHSLRVTPTCGVA